MKKERLDMLMLARGLAESREKARRSIMAGLVYVNGQKEDKPGTGFAPDAEIELRGAVLPYVSRGGLKLEKAMQCFSLKLEGACCLDVGASTGGFTDCMLQNGAARVYAIDVGHGQLDWKLRNDPRVVCMEKTNIRYVTPDMLGEAADFCSIDVSFISLSKVLPAVWALLKPGAGLVCLIKPQFEAGREQVGKKGVVRDARVHEAVIQACISFALGHGFALCGLSFSPIKGPEGNIEYLCYLRRPEAAVQTGAEAVEAEAEAQELGGTAAKALPPATDSPAFIDTALKAQIEAVVSASHASLDNPQEQE